MITKNEQQLHDVAGEEQQRIRVRVEPQHLLSAEHHPHRAEPDSGIHRGHRTQPPGQPGRQPRVEPQLPVAGAHRAQPAALDPPRMRHMGKQTHHHQPSSCSTPSTPAGHGGVDNAAPSQRRRPATSDQRRRHRGADSGRRRRCLATPDTVLGGRGGSRWWEVSPWRTVTDTAPTCGAACGAPPAPAPADVPREFPPGDQCRGGVVVASSSSAAAATGLASPAPDRAGVLGSGRVVRAGGGIGAAAGGVLADLAGDRP